MPQSSVFLRLQWPSTSSESSQEVSSVLSSSSCSSIDNAIIPRHESSRGSGDSTSPPPGPSTPATRQDTNMAPIPLSRSHSSPAVSWYDLEEDTSESSPPPATRDPKKVKLRTRGKELRARRMTRSLSTTSASVSTNTDPEDFLYTRFPPNYPVSVTFLTPSSGSPYAPHVIIPKFYKQDTGLNLTSVIPPLRAEAKDISVYSTKTSAHADPPHSSAPPAAAVFLKKLRQKALFNFRKKTASAPAPEIRTLHPVEEAAEDIPDLLNDCTVGRCSSSGATHNIEDPRQPSPEPLATEGANNSLSPPGGPMPPSLHSSSGTNDSFDFSGDVMPELLSSNVNDSFTLNTSVVPWLHTLRSAKDPFNTSENPVPVLPSIVDANDSFASLGDQGPREDHEGSESPARMIKKTVTFMLPPQYCDSFISEAGEESASGDYPPSGYAELDGTLIPPNGGNPYRNTPSPGLHGIPNDRYVDGVYEGEAFLGDHPDDGGFRGCRGDFEGEGYVREDPFRRRTPSGDYRRASGDGPSTGGYGSTRDIESYHVNESDVYGQLKPPDRGPYHVNGVLPPHHPLHPYEEEVIQRTSSATTPVAHPSPSVSATPLLSPAHTSPGPPTPTHNNHDAFVSPSLLRSPSTDSSSRVRWRDPDLHEVIDFLSNPNNIVKANAAAYLQHLCYMDDATKQKTRILGGIPPLVALLSHDLSELHRNACGALRNLSYGRQNDENKRAIKDAGGLPTLVRLLRKTLDNEVKELVTGILWNLSSCEDLKQSILDEALGVLVSHVIIPCSGWDGGEVERDPNNDVWWSTVFKNASGIVRNISSAGEYARTKLRHCPGLVDSLFCVIKLAIQGNSHDNKSVENCVCILRNLSYRCQEVEDPNYDKNQPPLQSRATATGKESEEDGSDKCGDNLGCFGGSRKKKEMVGGQLKDLNSGPRSSGSRGQPVRGMELLWQPDLVVQPYLALLSDCSNPETLEAAAGAIQNLAACYWQPSVDVRAAVRKEKGLPILVELLRMEVDRVVCAVATALRNLAIDQRNKELIGKYAMRDLVQKLPTQSSHDTATSDETIAAVLATLNEVIKKNAEFSRLLLDAGGVDRLVYITRQRGRYSTRVIKFASQVLFSMWGHQELREVYKKSGWKEQDFVSKSVAARNAAGGANSPTANNTLNRPMASQGGTRYEDRTIQRSNNQPKHLQYQRREEVPLADLGYGGDGGALGGVRIYGPAQGTTGEPVYAKVNRDKKRHKQYDTGGLYGPITDEWGDSPPAYSAMLTNHPSSNYSEPHLISSPSMADAANNNSEVPRMSGGPPAGDSWV